MMIHPLTRPSHMPIAGQASLLVKQPQTCQFSGSLKEITSRKDAQIERRWSTFLEKDLLTLNDGKPVKAWELLDLVKTCTQRDVLSPLVRGPVVAASLITVLPALFYSLKFTDDDICFVPEQFSSFVHGPLRGVSASKLYKILFQEPATTPAGVVNRQEVQLKSALEDLAKEGLVKENGSFATGKGSTKWSVTSAGKKAVRYVHSQKTNSAQAPAKTAVTKANPTGKAGNILTLEQLKGLVNKVSGELTGWNTLYRVHQESQKRGRAARLFSQGVSGGKLLKAFDMKESLELHRLLTELQQLGYLKAINPSANLDETRWAVSDFGLKVLEKGDPLLSDLVNEGLLNQYIDSEVKDLETERTQKKTQRKSLEDRYQKANEGIQGYQLTYEKEKAMGEDLYRQFNALPEGDQKGRLKQEALEKAYSLERLDKQINFELKMARQLKKQVETIQTLHMDWEYQIQQRIQRMDEAKLALSSSQTNQAVHQLLKELRSLDEFKVSSDHKWDERYTTLNQRIQSANPAGDTDLDRLVDDEVSLEVARASHTALLDRMFSTEVPPVTLAVPASAPPVTTKATGQ